MSDSNCRAVLARNGQFVSTSRSGLCNAKSLSNTLLCFLEFPTRICLSVVLVPSAVLVAPAFPELDQSVEAENEELVACEGWGTTVGNWLLTIFRPNKRVDLVAPKEDLSSLLFFFRNVLGRDLRYGFVLVGLKSNIIAWGPVCTIATCFNSSEQCCASNVPASKTCAGEKISVSIISCRDHL